jgi:predicted SPOUT superfamily RNA methylase MTH1
MKFIELTDYHSGTVLLINLNKVITIRDGYKSTLQKTKNVILDFGNDQYIHVKETYQDIKEIIEKY